MSRFVVLEHDHPELHWDFMLEHDGVLKTWRLDGFPLIRGKKVSAQAIAEHRLFYLDYEGPVSGNRGRVVRRAEGTYAIDYSSAPPDTDEAFRGGRLLLDLRGVQLSGLFALERVEEDAWQMELIE